MRLNDTIGFVRAFHTADQHEGKFIKGNNRLEVVWTIIPLGIVIYFSYLGSVSLAETQRVGLRAVRLRP